MEQRYPRVAEIQHLLAIILDLNRKPEEANRHFRRAVELQPDSVLFRTNLGASLMRLGRASEAAGEFEKALEMEPNNATASFNLGTILLQQGRPEQALPRLDKAFAIQPEVYENGYQLAYCHFLLGHYQAVDTVLKELAAPATARVELRLLQALTARALGRAEGVQEVLQEMKPLLGRSAATTISGGVVAPEPGFAGTRRGAAAAGDQAIAQILIRLISTWREPGRGCPNWRRRPGPHGRPLLCKKPERCTLCWGIFWKRSRSPLRR